MTSKRKIILEVAVSLDGLIEGPNGEYDWCFTDQDYGMKDFLKRIDTIFYGRKSWEVMTKEIEKSGSNPFAGKTNVVFSNTLKEVKGVQLIGGDLVEEVNRIRSAPGQDIWLFGGAALTASMMNAGLVDEVHLAVHPILLGKGKPLFDGLKERVKTNLINVKSYSTGLVSMEYHII